MKKIVKIIRCEKGHVLTAEKNPNWGHDRFEISRNDLPNVSFCPYCGSSLVMRKGNQIECKRCGRVIFSIGNPSWRIISHCKNWRYCPICSGLVKVSTKRFRID